MSYQHSTRPRSVTVIGLGPMGQAMVRSFLRAGIEVTVWNRSLGKAEAMVTLGAREATTVAEALDAGDVAVLSLTDYAAMYDVLGPAIGRLDGKVIVNLSSDSPQRARAGAAWVRSHGAEFLSGGVVSAGDDLDHPASYLFFGGPHEVFRTHAELLRPLGPQEYLGADDGLAQIFYQGLLTIFHPWRLAFDQATAMIAAAGHDIAQFVPFAIRSNAALPYFMRELTTANRKGGNTTTAQLTMMDAGAQHIIDTSREAGVDASLSHAAQLLWRRALDAGTRSGRVVPVFEVMTTPEPAG